MAYDFHYTPTGTGVISGKEVLEQTEDAINDLGNTAISGVQEALDKAEQALTNSENAVDDAQTALNTANNAEGVAIQAQTDVGNLSGTVANIGNRVTTAEGNITNLQGRMTTAEGNITNLQGRMTTAETNIGNLQTAVSTAQATANSAQQTATTARQQSYVFRYSSTALTASSTNSNALLDNTDNLKVDDKVIDSSGVLFSITAIDTANSTFTIGTALIDLAQDSDVVHKSGNETVGGEKTFTGALTASRNVANGEIILQNASYDPKTNGQGGVSTKSFSVNFVTALSDTFGAVSCYGVNDRTILRFTSRYFVDSQTVTEDSVEYNVYGDGSRSFKPRNNNNTMLGESTRKWKEVYANNYYYGANNVEFSTKFVTTDTAQNITATKSFTATQYIYNADTNASIPSLYLRNQISEKGNIADPNSQFIVFTDKNNKRLSQIQTNKGSSGETSLSLRIETTDNSNNDINSQINYYITKSGGKNFTANADNEVNLGTSGNKWKDVNTYLVNGLTPSSLSLPSDQSARIDISSYFTNTSNGGVNRYTAPSNGFVYLMINDVVTVHMYSQTTNSSTNFADTRGRSTAGQLYAFLPIRKGDVFTSQWYTTLTNVSLSSAYFIPCQGNV